MDSYGAVLQESGAQQGPDDCDEVQITNADFNQAYYPYPNAWDGKPFTEMTEWILKAMYVGRIRLTEKPGHTDYARWDVDTPKGTVTCGPSDVIGYNEGADILYVKKLLVIPSSEFDEEVNSALARARSTALESKGITQ